MKTFFNLLSISLFLLVAFSATAQVQKKPVQEKPEAVKENVKAAKAENHNTTSGQIAPVNAGTDGQNQNPAPTSKKGYDYYQAKSDMNSTGLQNKAQDHNSSRSNKTASSVDQAKDTGSVEKRVNKVESISVKQK